MDTFYFNKRKTLFRTVVFGACFIACLYALFLGLRDAKNVFTPLILSFCSGYLFLISLRMFTYAVNKKASLVITNEFVCISRPFNKPLTYNWTDIILFRQCSGVGYENVELKLYSRGFGNKSVLAKLWICLRQDNTFNLDILDASNAVIINSLDKHSLVVED